MTKEQIMEYLHHQLQQSIKIRDKFDEEFREEVTNDTKYIQYMVWYATCLTIEGIIDYINRSNTNNG